MSTGASATVASGTRSTVTSSLPFTSSGLPSAMARRDLSGRMVVTPVLPPASPCQTGGEGGGGAVVDAVGEPDDLHRTLAGGGLLDAGQGGLAVERPGNRSDGSRQAPGLLGRDELRLWRAKGGRGGDHGDRHRLGDGGIDDARQHRLAALPVSGRAPAVVDGHQQRAAVEMKAPITAQLRAGHGNDEERGESQANEEQPPGRLVGLVLRRDEVEQQAERRKAHGFRPWRRVAQQPPDHRQGDEPEKGRRSGEGEAGEKRHGRTRPCAVNCGWPPMIA